ncbi:helix-turn-helix domain-containing protein [Endozoicomonas atrinae]|uniref:helix-turn-helix domain-containing protein n=1 Tax=Endozoicomonas atrinae TaxID=1333660 RepID=UPI000B180E0D|nr:helix-turn-helix domain-containing protein [Endozoicomonas atrinae]
MKYLLWGTFITEFILLFSLFIRSSRQDNLRVIDRFLCLPLLVSILHLVMYIATTGNHQGQIIASTSYLILRSLLHPALFLTTLALLNHQKKTEPRDIVHFFPFIFLLIVALEGSWIQQLIPEQDWQAFIPVLALSPMVNLTLLLMLSIIFAGYQWATLKLAWPSFTSAWQHTQNDTALRWVCFFSIFNILFTILASLFYAGTRINHPDSAPDSGGEVYTLLSSLFTLAFCLFYLKSTAAIGIESPKELAENHSDNDDPEIISDCIKYRHSGLSDTESVHYFQMVDELLRTKKLYLEQNLKVADLSNEFGLGSSYISQVINQNTGSSFNDYINQFRVEVVKAKIETMANTGTRLLPKDLGYEAGFGSGSTFYKAFRQITGSTPKQYLVSCLNLENKKLHNPENSLQSLEPVE